MLSGNITDGAAYVSCMFGIFNRFQTATSVVSFGEIRNIYWILYCVQFLVFLLVSYILQPWKGAIDNVLCNNLNDNKNFIITWVECNFSHSRPQSLGNCSWTGAGRRSVSSCPQFRIIFVHLELNEWQKSHGARSLPPGMRRKRERER